MTPKLRELEAAAKPHNHTTCNLTCLEPDLRLEGYRMALEDVEPVLAAADDIANRMERARVIIKANGGNWNMLDASKFRDALAKFKGEE